MRYMNKDSGEGQGYIWNKAVIAQCVYDELYYLRIYHNQNSYELRNLFLVNRNNKLLIFCFNLTVMLTTPYLF
jgi:hypothetical protein